MKRIFLLMCAVALCVSLAGCSKSFSMEKPVNVYYCATSIKHDSPTGMLQAEKRDLQGWQGNLRGFLNEYLAKCVGSPKRFLPFTVSLVMSYPIFLRSDMRLARRYMPYSPIASAEVIVPNTSRLQNKFSLIL